jgi:hypothetical protein
MAQAAVSKPNKTSSAENPLLKFGTNGNAKLGKGVWHFSISSGSTCPGASICKAWVSVRKDGDTLKRTLHEGKDAQLRCFSASQEIAFSMFHLPGVISFPPEWSVFLGDNSLIAYVWLGLFLTGLAIFTHSLFHKNKLISLAFVISSFALFKFFYF